jgi:hypothetical protein
MAIKVQLHPQHVQVVKLQRTSGDTTPFIFDLYDEDGTALTLTSASAKLSPNTKRSPDGAAAEFDMTGGIVANQITFTPELADVTRTDVLYYDLRLTFSDSSTRTACRGSMPFYPARTDLP